MDSASQQIEITKIPVPNQYENILLELKDYKKAGGHAIVDCQPGGGRNGSILARLAKANEVGIIASTGFHGPVYYAPDYWLWRRNSDQLAAHFIEEIQSGLDETRDMETQVRAGLIKIACEDSINKTFQPGLLACAQAATQTGKIIEIHTEKGQHPAEILDFFIKLGVHPHQLVLCHMDKHPDVGLHQELVQAGAALEYDTFYRAKYESETNLWMLITSMLEAGYEDHICLGTDTRVGISRSGCKESYGKEYRSIVGWYL